MSDPLADLSNDWVGEAKGICMRPLCMYCDLAEYLIETSECDLQKHLLSDYKEGKAFSYIDSKCLKEVFYHHISHDSPYFVHEGRLHPLHEHPSSSPPKPYLTSAPEFYSKNGICVTYSSVLLTNSMGLWVYGYEIMPGAPSTSITRLPYNGLMAALRYANTPELCLSSTNKTHLNQSCWQRLPKIKTTYRYVNQETSNKLRTSTGA